MYYSPNDKYKYTPKQKDFKAKKETNIKKYYKSEKVNEKEIKVYANYYKIKADINVHVYSVEFEPNLDSQKYRNTRKGLKMIYLTYFVIK